MVHLCLQANTDFKLILHNAHLHGPLSPPVIGPRLFQVPLWWDRIAHELSRQRFGLRVASPAKPLSR